MNNKKIEIPLSGLFNEQECLWFLNRGFDDCMYTVYSDRVRRAFKSGDEIMLVDVYPMPDKLVLEWLNGDPSDHGISTVGDFVKNWFDLDSDLTAFYKIIAADERIAYMADEYRGLRFVGMPDFFEALAWCIIGQQINLTFAYTVKRRLVELYGDYVEYQNRKYYIFPAPEVLAKADINDLRTLQFSVKKAEYLITIAAAFADEKLSRKILIELPDLESRIKFLVGIRGIGLWTANYALMKSLKEPSCIPHGDAGLLNALVNHGIIKTKTDQQTITEFFKAFQGWESYLVFYLWRTLALTKEKE
jgi:DNA-3-methyladenine glycosylase II